MRCGLLRHGLIFPMFCRRNGQTVIQGFDCLSVLEIIAYLAERFKCTKTDLIRVEDRAYNLKTKRWRKVPGGAKKRKTEGGKG